MYASTLSPLPPIDACSQCSHTGFMYLANVNMSLQHSRRPRPALLALGSTDFLSFGGAVARTMTGPQLQGG
jgi:hypothetical protein